METDYRTINSCRICGSDELDTFLDFGNIPPVNIYADTPDESTLEFPLEVTFCEQCKHVQLKNTVARDLLFDEYQYFSSASDPIADHFAQMATELEDEFLSNGDLVVEIGSNDGVMLKEFSSSVKSVGIEPAKNVGEFAREEYGLNILTDYFSLESASTVVAEHGWSSLVVANNVLGHVDDLQAFMKGIDELLAKQGTFVIEVPYLIDLVNNVEFDTIYHEHISYFAVRPLVTLLEQFNMEVFRIDRENVHGGTIRVYIQRSDGPRERDAYIDHLISLEKTLDFGELETYAVFSSAVERRRQQLTDLLAQLKADGHTIVGYGASAKGNVLLNYCGIGPETVEYILDTTPAKQGTYSPGMKIPIRPPSEFRASPPDFALLLAWNYRDAIMEKERSFRDSGGHFIQPAPFLDIV